VLYRVDAAVADLDCCRPENWVHRGLWAAWLRWMLQLLAFELALAWGDPCCGSDLACDAWGGPSHSWPQAGGQTAPARPLPARVLDRKINRVLEAARHVWTFGHPPAARPLRRLRRRPMLRAFSRTGALGWRSCLARPTTSGIIGTRVLALCKP
jgi:hypothetical protein